MELSNRWTYFAIGIMITPVLMATAYLTSGGPDGDFLLFRLLYPLPCLFAFKIIVLPEPVRLLFFFPGVTFACLQYAIYGYIIGRRKDGLGTKLPIFILLALHGICLTICFLTPVH